MDTGGLSKSLEIKKYGFVSVQFSVYNGVVNTRLDNKDRLYQFITYVRAHLNFDSLAL